MRFPVMLKILVLGAGPVHPCLVLYPDALRLPRRLSVRLDRNDVTVGCRILVNATGLHQGELLATVLPGGRHA